MRTIKLVIIGDSGVGKTSFRSNYISGRFSSGYRATIGTDFITKTLPHHSNPGEFVTLQIWDTAGQERFSNLSTAFFRGADAVLMMYDVNNPATLQGLRKWWKDFQMRAPVPDEEASDYCCVVVGNKIDLADETEGGFKMPVSEEDARTLLEELIPVSSPSSDMMHPTYGIQQAGGRNSPHEEVLYVSSDSGFIHPDEEESTLCPKPIDIRSSNRQSSISRTTSRLRLNGTMTTTRTGLSVYYTPSSSVFDEFMSAPSSPIHSSATTLRIQHRGVSPSANRHKPTNLPTSSTAIRSISPSPSTSPLDRGPKLFLASAKSGHAVPGVFEYIAQRVVAKWEWEECAQTQPLAFTGRSSEMQAVHLSKSKDVASWTSACCS